MLKRRAIGAVVWSAADGFARQGLLFAASIVLARMLGPRDFGLIALVAMFTGIGAALLDGGFSAALIQRQDADRVDESTVFWFNAAIGFVVALAIWALGPAVAAFYRQPVLAPLMSLMAINVFVASLGAIHATLLAKELGFRHIMKVGTAANLVAGAVAILMAWRGYGVWSLAWQAIVTSAVSTVLYWFVHRWRPLPVFSTASARKLFGFGGYHLASTMIEIVYSRLYTLLLGRFYSVRELGLYTNADNTKQMPCGLFTGILMRAAFPMFSAAANDGPVLGRGVQVAVRCTMLLNVPIMIGMATVAKPLVLFLFGRDWLPMVPVLRVLCLVGVLWPLQVINVQALLAQGHSRLLFHIELLKKAIGLGLLLAGAWFGMMGIAWSQVLASLVAFAINARYAHRLLGYGAVAQARDSGPTVAVALVMGGAVTWLSTLMALPPAMELAVLAPFGAVVFLLLCGMLRLASMAEMMAVIRHGRMVPAVRPGGLP